eukprot:434138_1
MVALFLLWCSLFFMNVEGETYEWNILQKYGAISQKTIADGIVDARKVFENDHEGSDVVILLIDSGTYKIGGDGSYGIDLSKGMKPGNNGKFIIKGEGKDNTTLIFTDLYQHEIYGENLYHTTFQDFHMTRNKYTVSQGTVKEINIKQKYIQQI